MPSWTLATTFRGSCENPLAKALRLHGTVVLTTTLATSLREGDVACGFMAFTMDFQVDVYREKPCRGELDPGRRAHDPQTIGFCVNRWIMDDEMALAIAIMSTSLEGMLWCHV